jgi:hypothetical protein
VNRAMPLTRLRQEFLEQDGIRFLMEDENGSTVARWVSHEELRDHAESLAPLVPTPTFLERTAND